MKRNYQKELEQLIQKNNKEAVVPTLLLHSCCAPCSSYCIEYLSSYFYLTVLYYNPNISPRDEYDKRAAEQERLIQAMKTKYPVKLIQADYDPEPFFTMAKGLEQVPEGGERCEKCFVLRLEEAAKEAARLSIDYFTTSLSISPLKNASLLNDIGETMAEKYHVNYLNSDFKKKNGYLRSTELSKEYDLYRQNYCGCIYSKALFNSQKSIEFTD